MPPVDGNFCVSIVSRASEVGWVLAPLSLPQPGHSKGDGCPSVKAGRPKDRSEGNSDFTTKAADKGYGVYS